MREIQNKKAKKDIIVWDEKTKEIAGSTTEKIKIISEYFKKILALEHMENEYIAYPPTKMNIPFNQKEVKEAAATLKNGKSVGIDGTNAVLIKYAPDTTFKAIADMYNDVAKTGDTMAYYKHGRICCFYEAEISRPVLKKS